MVKITMKTKFMNSKRRAIFESKGKKGKITYFSMGDDKTRRYAPKARFHQTANGNVRQVKANNVVPARIRMASTGMARKERSNKGVKRGPRKVLPAKKISPVRAKKMSPLSAGAQMLLKMNAKKRRPAARRVTRM